MRPKVFVGSSVESLPIAHAIHENLEHDAEVTVWQQGVFQLSSTTLDDLIKALDKFDFGIFIFSPDDIVLIRNKEFISTRDNIVFELGLFVGRLGKERNFLVVSRGANDFRLPSDLIGVNTASYNPSRSDENMTAALGPACSHIKRAIKNLGAANSVKQSSSTLIDTRERLGEAKRYHDILTFLDNSIAEAFEETIKASSEGTFNPNNYNIQIVQRGWRVTKLCALEKLCIFARQIKYLGTESLKTHPNDDYIFVAGPSWAKRFLDRRLRIENAFVKLNDPNAIGVFHEISNSIDEMASLIKIQIIRVNSAITKGSDDHTDFLKLLGEQV